MSNHRDYLKKRLPELADEFDKILEGNRINKPIPPGWEEIFDSVANSGLILSFFDWQETPQGWDFWDEVHTSMVKNENQLEQSP